MAEQKNVVEREYIIPLRRKWMQTAPYKRTRKSVKAIKIFIAKHMKVPQRDVNKVKLDVYLNNEIWFRGSKHPPARVKVKARREGDLVHVDFVEVPNVVKFARDKKERMHKKADKKQEKPVEKKETEEKKEDKIAEIEKEKSVAEQNAKNIEKKAKEQKNVSRPKEPEIHKNALQR